MAFQALMVSKDGDAQKTEITSLEENDLMEGDALIDVAFSTINYKDGLALSGAAPIIRRFPMIAGIDLSGRVVEAGKSDFKKGDKIVLNGFGLGEVHYGGYAEKARVKSEWLVPLPQNISEEQAMALGTAGYTAMLSLMALERHGVNPDAGDILVTGAAGGVGSVAVALLASLGYRVIASTGRGQEEEAYLKALGAADIIARKELSEAGAPIAKERFAGAIDSVGSHTLANVLAQTRYGGCVACCGLAQGLDLPASVAPFILRGITLAGIDSVMAPQSLRREAWARLGRDWDRKHFDAIARKEPLAKLPALAKEILAGKIRGRVVIDVHASP